MEFDRFFLSAGLQSVVQVDSRLCNECWNDWHTLWDFFLHVATPNSNSQPRLLFLKQTVILSDSCPETNKYWMSKVNNDTGVFVCVFLCACECLCAWGGMRLKVREREIATDTGVIAIKRRELIKRKTATGVSNWERETYKKETYRWRDLVFSMLRVSYLCSLCRI